MDVRIAPITTKIGQQRQLGPLCERKNSPWEILPFRRFGVGNGPQKVDHDGFRENRGLCAILAAAERSRTAGSRPTDRSNSAEAPGAILDAPFRLWVPD